VKPASYIFYLSAFLFSMSLSGPVKAQQYPAQNEKNRITDTIEVFNNINERLQLEYAKKANQISNYYLIAQRAMYKKEYQKALENIDLALAIHKNADLLALKGSIFFAMGSFERAKAIFSEAFKMDKNLPVPLLAGLNEWLMKEGLRKK
jgi:tetratricopeptide (TPR) repeat protein